MCSPQVDYTVLFIQIVRPTEPTDEPYMSLTSVVSVVDN